MHDALKAYASLKRPFASLDMEAMDWNIGMVNRLSKTKQVRIATKSVRSVELLHYIAQKLTNHVGWMTFDCEETQFLLEKGFDNFLIGYPQIEKAAIASLVPYIANGSKVVFMVDCEEQLAYLNKIGEAFEVRLDICLDINLSTEYKWMYFGTRRSSLHTLENVMRLCTKQQEYKWTDIVGIMGYEAQIAGVTDQSSSKWQTPVIRMLKQHSKKKLAQFRQEVVREMTKSCPSIQFVNGGGTGSIEFTSQAEEVTELTIGSAFFYPALFSRYDHTPYEPAMTYALRVTRKPSEQIVVCHGGGYVASGATGVDKNPVPLWPPNLTLLKHEGAGEVQTPLYDKDRTLKIGDTVFFRHAKAGELCEHFTEIHARRGDRYVKTFKTYRGEGRCFI
ncbi:amino acid deaminase/aldolase [Sporosarcina sp. OR05]|uniref:amino acid deaminase/aldolase n=1 Tax=Sporosarcina sp. OR05 TaxID=2969819 RepID=UPI00352BCF8A